MSRYFQSTPVAARPHRRRRTIAHRMEAAEKRSHGGSGHHLPHNHVHSRRSRSGALCAFTAAIFALCGVVAFVFFFHIIPSITASRMAGSAAQASGQADAAGRSLCQSPAGPHEGWLTDSAPAARTEHGCPCTPLSSTSLHLTPHHMARKCLQTPTLVHTGAAHRRAAAWRPSAAAHRAGPAAAATGTATGTTTAGGR